MSGTNGNGRMVERVCETCDGTFEVDRWQVESGRGGFFCSHSCRGKRVGNGQPARRCQICGVSISPTPREVKRGRGKYCSKLCAGKGQPKKRPLTNGNDRFRLYPPGTYAVGSLPPGTKFRAGTTEGVVLRQHPVMKETLVGFIKYGSSQGARVRSRWSPIVRVEVVE